jgi:hypothetical protein
MLIRMPKRNHRKNSLFKEEGLKLTGEAILGKAFNLKP